MTKKRKRKGRKVVRKTTNKTSSNKSINKSNTTQNKSNGTKPKIAPKQQNKVITTSAQVHKSTATQNKPNNGGIISKLISVFIKDHKDSNGGHPHVIVDNVDNKHVSVGLTTQRYKGKSNNAGKNYPLKNNPLDLKSEPTFMRRQATIDNKNNYSNSRTGVMEENDYKKAKEYGEKAKKKYMDKKNENKKE